jgi:acyl-coenzyme A thioesterase PaaI-like protein
MSLAVTEREIQDLLSTVPFTRQYGFRLHALGEGECAIEVPFQEMFERPGAVVSGQVFMAAADVAMWLALMTRLGKDDASVTADMTTAFLSAARREAFRCHATILKLGARLVYGVAECRTLEGKLLTHHGVTYIRAGGRAAA